MRTYAGGIKRRYKSGYCTSTLWRAYSYFYLVTTWGRVPIMLKEEIDYNAPLKTEEEVYELIRLT